MGVDLTLFIDRYSEVAQTKFLAYDRLSMDRCTIKLFGMINHYALPSYCALSVYDDAGLKEVTSDAVGNPLRYVLAGEVTEFFKGEEFTELLELATDWNRSVLAFIAALNPYTAIVLWWH